MVDTAHGHSQGVLDMVRRLKGALRCRVIAGNVATAEATEALIDAGADAVKVGIGPGSICTTRIVAGAGVPQVTAIFDCVSAAARHDIPVIADGGIQSPATSPRRSPPARDAVMLGCLLAGVDESPATSFSTRASASRSTAAWARSAR